MTELRIPKALLTVLSVFVIAGCAMHAAIDDLSDNKYLNAEPFPNQNASYIGVWTTNMSGGLVCIRINPDGTGKYCQNKIYGPVERIYLRIYKEKDGTLFMINEAGVRYKINEYSNDYMDTTAYGSKWRFVRGVKSANCEDFLAN